jgi:hypothetical protein
MDWLKPEHRTAGTKSSKSIELNDISEIGLARILHNPLDLQRLFTQRMCMLTREPLEMD